MSDIASDYSSWIGRSEIVDDDVSPATAEAAAALFDEPGSRFACGAELPPLWHWFYFLPKASQSRLGGDGHPQREPDSFMPPLPLSRRMFAGARLSWHRALRIGQSARREAIIHNIEVKSGRSGALAFITVRNRYFQDLKTDAASPRGEPAGPSTADLCIEEEQDIVYREPGPPLPAPKSIALPATPAGAWSRTVAVDSRLLFRFSALTFNAHRIHYDRPYATAEEGYPGLVVHGPLTAMLLLRLVRDHIDRPIDSFRFRSQSPLFDLSPFHLLGMAAGNAVELQAVGPDGSTAMVATARFT